MYPKKKQFYLFIPPDKHRIYGEYYPGYIKKSFSNDQSKTNQLVNYLTTNTNVKIIYPYESLMEHKKDGFLYYKTDTHWTSLGAYFGYKALMGQIVKDFYIDVLQGLEMKDEQILKGDLANMYPFSLKNDETIYKIPFSECNYSTYVEMKLGDVMRMSNISKKYKIMMFGDSFSIKMVPYLGNTFGEVLVFLPKYPSKEDFKNNDGVDIVVIEVVERRFEGLLEYILYC